MKSQEPPSEYDEEELERQFLELDSPDGPSTQNQPTQPQLQFSEADKADLDRVLFGKKPSPDPPKRVRFASPVRQPSPCKKKAPKPDAELNEKIQKAERLLDHLDANHRIYREMLQFDANIEMGIGHVPGPEPLYADNPEDVAKARRDRNPRPTKRGTR